MASHGDTRLPLRFWNKVEVRQASQLVATPCWVWVAYVMPKQGYGMFRWDLKTCLAHRVAYQTLVGQIPKGLEPDHLCRVRTCTNPDHMELVTRQVNVLRGEASAAKFARRTVCGKGHPLSGTNLIPCRLKHGLRKCRTCYNAWQSERQKLKNAA